MMKRLHKKSTTAENKQVMPNEGERTLLCSNESGMRSPSLGLESNLAEEANQLLDQLASILVDHFLQQQNEHSNNK